MKLIEIWNSFTPEHPRKYDGFEALSELDWKNDFSNSIELLFNKVDAMACYEIKYYYRRRQVRSFVSFLTRFIGWLFGAIGLIIPLVAATNTDWKDVSAWGFVFVAISGALFGANSLFGGTTGHISFTVAQLTIEKFMLLKRIEWRKIKAKLGDDFSIAENKDDCFNFIIVYVEGYTDIAIRETQEWKNSMMAALAKFNKDSKAES